MSEVEVKSEAGVRWITLNRPESKNGLTDAVNAAIIEALDGAAADKAIRCVVVTGAGGNFAPNGLAALCQALDILYHQIAGCLIKRLVPHRKSTF